MLNELLHFSADRIPNTGLTRLALYRWDPSIGEIEPELLTLLSGKASSIKRLEIGHMSGASPEVRRALAALVGLVIG